MTGQATINSKSYFKANIEGGEKFNWFYFDTNNRGRGLDPNGSDLQVSRPEGDRPTQSRNQFFANQQILGNKQLRWWWNNTHFALYDDGDGRGDESREHRRPTRFPGRPDSAKTLRHGQQPGNGRHCAEEVNSGFLINCQ